MRFDLALPCGHVGQVRDAFFESDKFAASTVIECPTCGSRCLAIELGHDPWVLIAYLPRSL
jgi:DNA-directed RNA polymerase subunit RPC12/RpoP